MTGGQVRGGVKGSSSLVGTFCGEIFSKEIIYCSWLAGYIPRVLSKGDPLTGERGTFHEGEGKILVQKKRSKEEKTATLPYLLLYKEKTPIN